MFKSETGMVRRFTLSAMVLIPGAGWCFPGLHKLRVRAVRCRTCIPP